MRNKKVLFNLLTITKDSTLICSQLRILIWPIQTFTDSQVREICQSQGSLVLKK